MDVAINVRWTDGPVMGWISLWGKVWTMDIPDADAVTP